MKCTVCTFVNASWHGCAPTIMYCLASGSGYREPVSTQVFAISAMLSRSSLTLSLSLSCAHTHSHLFLPLPHSLVHIFFYIYTRTHFCFPFFSLFSPFFFPPPFRWEISTLETSAPQRWNQARLSLIKRRGGEGSIREDSSWILRQRHFPAFVIANANVVDQTVLSLHQNGGFGRVFWRLENLQRDVPCAYRVSHKMYKFYSGKNVHSVLYE